MRTRVLLVAAALAAGSAAPVAVASSGSTLRVSHVPTSIDGSGRTDVTNALNGFLSSVGDGTKVEFPPHRHYRIEGTLRVEGHHDLVIDGGGSVFFARTDGLNRPAPTCGHSNSAACRFPNRTRSQWAFVNDTDVVVQDLHVVGSDQEPGPKGKYDPALEAQHAFDIGGVAGIVLDHVTASNVWGDFVYVGRVHVGKSLVRSSNVTVKNSTFRGASRQGWTITDGQRVTFVDNTVDSVRRSLIDIEANTKTNVIADVVIRNNRLGSSRFCTLSNIGAAATEHDFLITGNRSLDSLPLAFCIQGWPNARRSNYTVTNNVGTASRRPTEPMVSVAYVDNVVVRNNVQHFSSTRWPTRKGVNGSPQAPVNARCSSVTAAGNRFTNLPKGMPASVSKAC